MKSVSTPSNYAATVEEGRSSAEILILPDGRILAHNITPAVAAVLAELDPADEPMRLRAAALPVSSTPSQTSAAPHSRS
jgi:hypothetical protein